MEKGATTDMIEVRIRIEEYGQDTDGSGVRATVTAQGHCTQIERSMALAMGCAVKKIAEGGAGVFYSEETNTFTIAPFAIEEWI
jgi:hypothetical protein